MLQIRSSSRGLIPPSTTFHRHFINDTRFSPFVPPSPASLTKPRPLPSKYSKYVRRLLYTSGLVGSLFLADIYLNYATLTRNLRTIITCAVIAADYKLNFNSGKDSSQLSDIHERNADRLLKLCLENGGLYQKIGQAIAMQSAILPPVVAEKFSSFFDETPPAPYRDVERVIKQDFGHRFPGLSGAEIVDRLFLPGSFEKLAVGSASVAQVHKALLRSGEEVAVKVQKPWIKRQVGLDLWVFRGVAYSMYKVNLLSFRFTSLIL
jgi:aarF domain-containing kinase